MSQANNYQKAKRKVDPLYFKNIQLKHEYGITLTEYNQMFADQNGLCSGCYTHQSQLKRSLSVDHNHKTGKVRGLLCGNCNRGLGYLWDNAQVLRRLADYLDGGK